MLRAVDVDEGSFIIEHGGMSWGRRISMGWGIEGLPMAVLLLLGLDR